MPSLGDDGDDELPPFGCALTSIFFVDKFPEWTGKVTMTISVFFPKTAVRRTWLPAIEKRPLSRRSTVSKTSVRTSYTPVHHSRRLPRWAHSRNGDRSFRTRSLPSTDKFEATARSDSSRTRRKPKRMASCSSFTSSSTGSPSRPTPSRCHARD